MWLSLNVIIKHYTDHVLSGWGEEINLDIICSPGNFSKFGGNMLRTCVHILIIHSEEGEIMKLVQDGR